MEALEYVIQSLKDGNIIDRVDSTNNNSYTLLFYNGHTICIDSLTLMLLHCKYGMIKGSPMN